VRSVFATPAPPNVNNQPERRRRADHPTNHCTKAIPPFSGPHYVVPTIPPLILAPSGLPARGRSALVRQACTPRSF